MAGFENEEAMTDYRAVEPTRNAEHEACKEGGLCFYCGELCEPYHWAKHDPEGLDEEMNGDDWP